MANDEFVYDDPDGSFAITLEMDTVVVRYDTGSDLSTVCLMHYPHDQRSFAEFLLAAGRACMDEVQRLEMESMQTKLIRRL